MNALFREQFARLCRAAAQKKKKDDDDERGTFSYHQLTILAQHAYALSLGATVLKEAEEEEKELKPVQRRTYVAVPEERITTRFDIVLQACDWTKRGGGEKNKNSSCRKFVTFATFREETYSSSSGGNGVKIFNAK